MSKNIKTWEERAHDAIASGEFVGFPHGHMPAEIADLRAHIAELESRPAAPVVAEGRGSFEALMRADGWGDEHFEMREGFEGLGYTSQSMQGAWRCYRAILASHPVAPAVVAEGYWLAPNEPTPEMIEAGKKACESPYRSHAMRNPQIIYEAMRVAHPVAGSPADGAQTDLAKRLLEIADKTGGQHSAVSVLKADLIAICCEANRYYDGMLAWKKTAEKKDADWNAERMSRIDERCTARATAAPVPASEAASEQAIIDCFTKAGFWMGVDKEQIAKLVQAARYAIALAAPAAPTDIPHGAALGANGVTYYGIEGMHHRMEEGEALHMWLDDAQVPRADADGKVYSLVGRVKQYAAAPTDAKPAEDILHEAQQRMWTALDRKACPGVWIQIASDAVLGFKKDSYGSDLPAAQSVRDAVQPTAAPGKEA